MRDENTSGTDEAIGKLRPGGGKRKGKRKSRKQRREIKSEEARERRSKDAETEIIGYGFIKDGWEIKYGPTSNDGVLPRRITYIPEKENSRFNVERT